MTRKILLFTLFNCLIALSFAQTLLNENFNYKSGALTSLLSGANVSGGNWVSFSGSGVNLNAVSGSLSYQGYGSSGIGNSITMVGTTASAEDAYRAFPTQTGKMVYAAFLIKLSDTVGLAANASTTPDYFGGFLTSTSTTTFYARLQIKKSATGNGFQLGIRTTATSTISFASQNLGVDTVHLIVIGYNSVSGTANDTSYLWINPSTSVQPSSADAKGSPLGTDATDITRFFLRQGNAGTPNCNIDGLHVGLSWNDIMSNAISQPGAINTMTSLPYLTSSSITWNRPGDYDPATMQTVAFLKKTSAPTSYTASGIAANYTANTDFSVGGSAFPADTNAKCIFNGDTNTVNVTGLAVGTTYYAFFYVIRNADTIYSNYYVSTTTTQAKKPTNVSGATFSNTSYNTTTLTWTKPATYADSNMTTLVFIKASAQVLPVGTVDASPASYSANPNFSTPGTPFLNDTLAKCIYNGDGNLVNISGLQAGVTYYVGYYVVRTTDSNYYSTLGAAGVITTSMPSPVTALNLNATSQTTATVIWTRPTTYANNTMTTLVFVKQGSPINTVEHPSKITTAYTANPDFSIGGTPFQYDALAKCVMNSDSNNINITGLTIGTNYHVLVYVVRTADSAYSLPSVANGNTYGAVPPPSALKSISINAFTTNTANISWVKDSTYSDSTYSTVVFIKKSSAIVQGAPDLNLNSYAAATAFGSGTFYQNDSNAFCVYKGIGTSVSVSGLLPATSYFVAAWVVRKDDSSYSNAVSSFGVSVITPPTAVTFTGLTSTSTRVSWTKPSGYINANYSTLVFLKADNAIIEGTPTRVPTAYTASVTLGNGTRYQNDSNAYCVFRADTNFVNITGGLIQGRTYHALVLVVRDADSVYASSSAIGNGKTLPPPAPIQIGKINSTNPTTGNPDSLNVRVTLRGVVYGFNQATNGLKFLMRDITGGITIVNTTKNFGYTVFEGDSIEVQGTVGTTRGLNIVTIDTLTYFTSGSSIKRPSLVAKLGENTENDLVRVNNLAFLTPPTGTTWLPTTYSCVSSSTGDTVTIRINTSNPIVGSNLPTAPTFDVIGMGSQVSTSTVAPFLFNGYQLLPRSLDDIIEHPIDSLTPFGLLTPGNNATATIDGAGTANFTFNWNASRFTGTGAVTYLIQIDTAGASFTSPRMSQMSNNSGIDTVFTITAANLSQSLGLKPINVYHLIWRVVASANSLTRNSDATNAMVITRNYMTGTLELNASNRVGVYPNPAINMVTISGIESGASINILDEMGRVCFSTKSENSSTVISTSELKRGVYFVEVQTQQGVSVHKLLLQ